MPDPLAKTRKMLYGHLTITWDGGQKRANGGGP